MSEVVVVARYEKPGEPYIRVRLSDGRVVREHRFIMEQAIGRRLEPWEHVHHKDENKRNNALGNLELTTNADHVRGHRPTADVEELECPTCGRRFTRKLRYLKAKRRQGHKTFFCGNRCSRTGRSQAGAASAPVACACAICDKEFEIPANQYRLRVNRSRTGKITCSRSCGKRLGAMVK